MPGALTRLEGLDRDRRVRHLWTALIPDVGTCASLFEGPDRHAVEAANREARFDFDRAAAAAAIPGPVPQSVA